MKAGMTGEGRAVLKRKENGKEVEIWRSSTG